jgi:hypothetical protein
MIFHILYLRENQTVLPTSSSISRRIATTILAGVFLSSSVNAGHYDIVPYATGTGIGASLLTGGYGDLGGLPTEQNMNVFGYDFGETDPFFAGDPGFNNSSAFTTGIFPNDGELPSGSLMLSVFSGTYGSLRYWDGTGEANFVPVTGGIEINLNRGGSNLRVGATTTSGAVTIATVPAVGPTAGRVHQHLTTSIGEGGSGSSFAPLGAPDGLYAFGATLSVGGLVSDPIYFVFNQGMSEAIHDEGIDFYSAHAVPEPSSIALAGLGVAGLVGAALRRRMRKQ